MRKIGLRWAAATIALILALTGCGPQLSKEQRQSRQQGIPGNHGQEANRLKSEALNGKTSAVGPNGATIRIQETGAAELNIPIVTAGHAKYVVGTDFANAVGYSADWDEQQKIFQLGDTGTEYELRIDSLTAMKADQNITLAEPPVLRNAQVHIPVSALEPLFSEDFTYGVRGDMLVIHATDFPVSESIDGPEEVNTGSELDFEDDPADPFKGDKGTDSSAAAMAGTLPTDGDNVVPVLKNMDMNALIVRAKRYLGVDFKFGAAPYPKSGRFDCSTFTQYVYGTQGVKLNRSARAQARQGTTVDRKSLRKGDLMFFYVPGRFRSNKTVGHVGIYMGNQKMIHSSPMPQNGVQITNINKAYWKRTYLGARRAAY